MADDLSGKVCRFFTEVSAKNVQQCALGAQGRQDFSLPDRPGSVVSCKLGRTRFEVAVALLAGPAL